MLATRDVECGARPHGVGELEVPPLARAIDSRGCDQCLGSLEVALGDGRVDRDHSRLGDSVVVGTEIRAGTHGDLGGFSRALMITRRPPLDGDRGVVLGALLNVRRVGKDLERRQEPIGAGGVTSVNVDPDPEGDEALRERGPRPDVLVPPAELVHRRERVAHEPSAKFG